MKEFYVFGSWIYGGIYLGNERKKFSFFTLLSFPLTFPLPCKSIKLTWG